MPQPVPLPPLPLPYGAQPPMPGQAMSQSMLAPAPRLAPDISSMAPGALPRPAFNNELFLAKKSKERSIGEAAVRAMSGLMKERKAKKEEAERRRGTEAIAQLHDELRQVRSQSEQDRDSLDMIKEDLLDAIAERDAEKVKRMEAEERLAKAEARLASIKAFLNDDISVPNNAESNAESRPSMRDEAEKYDALNKAGDKISKNNSNKETISDDVINLEDEENTDTVFDKTEEEKIRAALE